MNNDRGIVFVLLLAVIMLLQGCTAAQEELTKDMVSKMPGYYNLFIIADDREQVDKYKSNHENILSDKSRKILYHKDVIWAFDEGKRNYTKAFGIQEYPMYLVFDEDKLVLKTTNIEEVDDFLKSKEIIWN